VSRLTLSMAETEINVVGLSSGKKGGKSNWKIIGAIIGIVVLALGIIAGILLVRQQQDIREKAQIVSCTDPTVEQCPVAGSPNILRNCHPPEANNSPVESLCDAEGKVSFCGTKNYCCPSAGGNWTTDMSVCTIETYSRLGILPEADITCSQGFTDEFNTINTAKWDKYGDTTIQSGVLVVKREELGTTSGIAAYDGLVNKDSLTGDFVVEFDITDVEKTGTGGGGAVVAFLTDSDTTDRLAIIRKIKNDGTYEFTSSLAVGSSPLQTKNVSLPRGSVTVKVERKSGKFKIYKKTGSSYEVFHEPQGTLTKKIDSIQLSALNTSTQPTGSYILAKYDNFRISCADGPTSTPTGTGQTSTPTATTSTGVRTATPTATGIRTSTPTATATSGIGGGVATATATSRATATASSAPIPVTGVNLPTILGTGFGIIMILVSLALAL